MSINLKNDHFSAKANLIGRKFEWHIFINFWSWHSSSESIVSIQTTASKQQNNTIWRLSPLVRREREKIKQHHLTSFPWVRREREKAWASFSSSSSKNNTNSDTSSDTNSGTFDPLFPPPPSSSPPILPATSCLSNNLIFSLFTWLSNYDGGQSTVAEWRWTNDKEILISVSIWAVQCRFCEAIHVWRQNDVVS